MPAVASGSSCDPIEASLRASLGSVSGGSCVDSLEDRIAASAKKVLLTKIEYVPADKEYTATLKCLQTKYIHLKLNSSDADVATACKEESRGTGGAVVNGNCEERSWSVESGDGIPKPRVVIHPSDNVKLGWTRVYKIGAGLANLGNTCFLNATLQCLTYTPPLVNHLIEYNEHSSSCKNLGFNSLFSGKNVGFCMMCELQRHIRRALDKNGEIIRPQCILQKLRSIAAHMSWGRQEDAHEFLRYVMESMVSASLNGFSNSKLDRISFETTVVNQIFGGYHRSQVICLRCKERSDTYDHFMDLMLDIKNVQSLEKAMENFVQPEVLDSENAYMCPTCKQKCPAKKRFTIHRAPNIATFQLKRFDYSRSLGGKITKHISFPEKFDMRSCMSQRQGLPIMYLLYAVLVHQGPSCNSGHYFCFVRNSNNLWYLMDDGKVRQVSLSVVLSQQAYLLFYTRIPHNGQLLKSPLQQASNSRLLHLPGQTALTNGVVSNPVNDTFGVPIVRKHGMFPSNLLKPKSSLSNAAFNTANSTKSSISSAASCSSSSSSSASSTNTLPINRDKVTFDFKISSSSTSGGGNSSSSGSNNGSSSSANSSQTAENSAKSPCSTFGAPSSSGSGGADANQQKHPRIVMHIKNGKVYNLQQEWGSSAPRTVLSTSDACNGPSVSSRSGSSLVPYAPDSSEDSSDQDTTGRLTNMNARKHLPKGYDPDADKSLHVGDPLVADVSVAKIKPESEVCPSKEEHRLANGKKANHADSQLTVMIGQNSAKVNATSQQWVVVDGSQQSPSVASEGSNNSVNSTTGWTVTDHEKETGNSKGDRRYNRWPATPPMVNGLKKQSSSSEKCKKSHGENDENRKVQSRLATDQLQCARNVCGFGDGLQSRNGMAESSVNCESDDVNARLSYHKDTTVDMDTDSEMLQFVGGVRLPHQKRHSDADTFDEEGGESPLPPLMNGHGSRTADDQATKRHKKRKKNKREKDCNESADDSNVRKKIKHKRETIGPTSEETTPSKRKRKRSSSENSSSSGGGSSNGGGNSSCSFELEWVEKTKETLKEKKEDSSAEFTTKNPANDDCIREPVVNRELPLALTITNGETNKHPVAAQSNGTATVDELLKNSGRGYGTGVCSWDGERSNVDRDVERDNQFKRFDRCSNNYDDDYDRGKIKKVKKLFSQCYRNSDGNPFQQAYDMKSSGNYYQRQPQPYQWRPPLYQQPNWGDSRRGARRGNHSFYHHNGNRARHYKHY